MLISLSVKLILDIPYRKQLPVLPDFQTLPEPLKEQISTAFAKAKWNSGFSVTYIREREIQFLIKRDFIHNQSLTTPNLKKLLIQFHP